MGLSDLSSCAKAVASSSHMMGNPPLIVTDYNPVPHGVENELTQLCGHDSFIPFCNQCVSATRMAPTGVLWCWQLEISLYCIPPKALSLHTKGYVGGKVLVIPLLCSPRLWGGITWGRLKKKVLSWKSCSEHKGPYCKQTLNAVLKELILVQGWSPIFL